MWRLIIPSEILPLDTEIAFEGATLRRGSDGYVYYDDSCTNPYCEEKSVGKFIVNTTVA